MCRGLHRYIVKLPPCLQERCKQTPSTLDAEKKDHCDLYKSVREKLLAEYHHDIVIPAKAGPSYCEDDHISSPFCRVIS